MVPCEQNGNKPSRNCRKFRQMIWLCFLFNSVFILHVFFVLFPWSFCCSLTVSVTSQLWWTTWKARWHTPADNKWLWLNIYADNSFVASAALARFSFCSALLYEWVFSSPSLNIVHVSLSYCWNCRTRELRQMWFLIPVTLLSQWSALICGKILLKTLRRKKKKKKDCRLNGNQLACLK